jgi:beta-glucosidase
VLTLTKDAFSFYDVGIKDWIIESGQFELRIGSSSRDIRLTTTIDINDGQTPSMLARETHPPDTSVLIAPDDQFCRRLGVESLPSPTLELTPFHYNSRLLELEATTLGGYFVRLIRRAAAKGLPEEMREDDAQLEMVHQVVDNTPLRGLVLFSAGKMTFTDLELLLAILNFAAFHIIVQRLWSVIKKRCSSKRR